MNTPDANQLGSELLVFSFREGKVTVETKGGD